MKVILFLVGILAPQLFYAQSFEGEIIYQVSYTSKMQGVTNERITNAMGDKNEYYIKGGDYKNVTNGAIFQSQLYRNADNRLYNKMTTSTAYLWINGAENKDTVFKSNVVFGAVHILGYTCDELTLYCRSGVQKYYFSSQLGVDSRLYAKHQFGNWADYVSRAHALPLKMIIENAQYTIEETAVVVKPMHLDPAIFLLPKGALLTAGPEN